MAQKILDLFGRKIGYDGRLFGVVLSVLIHLALFIKMPLIGSLTASISNIPLYLTDEDGVSITFEAPVTSAMRQRIQEPVTKQSNAAKTKEKEFTNALNTRETARELSAKPSKKRKRRKKLTKVIIESAEFQRYLAIIRNQIESNKYYPPEARSFLLKGKSKIFIRIYKDGTLNDIKISRSSSSKFIDGLALKTVEKASPFPPFPSILLLEFYDEIDLVVPLEYKLNYIN